MSPDTMVAFGAAFTVWPGVQQACGSHQSERRYSLPLSLAALPWDLSSANGTFLKGIFVVVVYIICC